MMVMRFTVPGRVKRTPSGKLGKARPVTWQRLQSRGNDGRYVDAEQRAEKDRIGQLALAARPPAWPRDGEYEVSVIGYWPDRVTGDADRLTSLVMDALEGVLYTQDRQVKVQHGAILLDRAEGRSEVMVRYRPSGADWTDRVVR